MTTKTLLNLSWDDQDPTLFLGQSLGIADYVNIKHPILQELALLQRSQYWIETEQSMTNDRKQWPTLPQHYKDITSENLAWQTLTDSWVARAPEAVLTPLASRPELEGMIKQWGYFEDIHSRAYSNIIQNVMPDPGKFIRERTQNREAYARLAGSISFFDELAIDGRNWDMLENPNKKQREHMQLQILKAYIMVYGLEAMQFYSSFACTFALAEEDVLPGIASNLKLIARDEAVHTRMSKAIIDIHSSQISNYLVEEAMEWAPSALLQTHRVEQEWGNYLFREGRFLPKLNSEILSAYTSHISGLAYGLIGIEMPNEIEVVKEDPIPWLTDNWLSTTHFQPTPQEVSVDSYKVGQTISTSADELSDLNIEF